MSRQSVEKGIVTAVLVAWWLWCPMTGYGGMQVTDGGETAASGLWGHVLYMVSHANVWHLLGNVFVLWLIPGRLRLLQAVAIAVLCSFLPVLPGVWELWREPEEPLMTVGFSGVLFAIIGQQWGVWIGKASGEESGRKRSQRGNRWPRVGSWRPWWTFCRKVLPFVMVGALFPSVNWSIHLWCVTAGVAVGLLSYRRR